MCAETRYPTDLTDDQWFLVEPLIPMDTKTGKGGRPPEVDRREIVNAILYITRAGCAWRLLPKDFPQWQLVYYYFRKWSRNGTRRLILDTLRDMRRAQEGRDSDPTAAVVDSQSIRGADTVGADSRGYDAGKKVNGRKRHITTDTVGLLLTVVVTAASVQDRDGARPVLKSLATLFMTVSLVFADGGYRGQLVDYVCKKWKIKLDIVKKPAGQQGFAVLPRRWVVERTLAWLMRHRRLVRDYERLPENHEAYVEWAMIANMLNRLQPRPGRRPWGPNRVPAGGC